MSKKIIFVLAALLMALQLSSQRVIVPGAESMTLYLPMLQGKRVAVCGNQTSVVRNTHLVDTLLAEKVNVVKIFCPEHGFRGRAEAGAHIASSVDEHTGLPIVSLYGNNRKPQPAQLADVDVIVFDLQDVGCRFYTYISTLHYVMEAAAEQDVEVLVLDRPNPNGYFVDGPVLEPKFRSFVGMHPVPVVYGMTIGEYALMINGEGWLADGQKCSLTVIRLENYSHDMQYDLPIAPSPNLPNAAAIYLYPSLCLFEGTPVSVGRGTNLPFQIFGFPGFSEGDTTFTPQSIAGVAENPPCKGKTCHGICLVATAREGLNSRTNSFKLHYLLTAYQHTADKGAFFTAFFDKLAGTDQLRKQIVAGKSEQEIRDSWQSGLEAFKTVRARYLLYPESH